MGLISEVGYGEITVEDVLERADVSRGTFYTHYRDIDDLFDQVVDDVVQRFRDSVERAAPPTSVGFTGEPVRAVIELVSEEPATFGALLQGQGNGRALQRLRTEFAGIAEATMRRRAIALGVTPRLPLDVLAQAWTGELLTVLTWWLEQGQPYSTEALATMLRDYAIKGRAWANGFDSDVVASLEPTADMAESASLTGAMATMPLDGQGAHVRS